MTIKPSTCPECGGTVHGTCELIPGTAVLQQSEGDGFEYSGWTDICWDGQRTEYVGGRARVCCERGHEWLAFIAEN